MVGHLSQFGCLSIVILQRYLCDNFRNGKFWMLAVPYSMATGVYYAWGSVIDVVLKPLGISEVIWNFYRNVKTGCKIRNVMCLAN